MATGGVTPSELESLNTTYKVLGIVKLEVSFLDEGTVDSKGCVLKVAVHPSMFSGGLRLPFYHSVRDVLHYLCLVPTQLHPNAWRILVSC